MKTIYYVLILCLGCIYGPAASASEELRGEIAALLHEEIMVRADAALEVLPVTVTATPAVRSAGGIQDFYSEGDYWWPDPQNPDGPYIRRDGETNPDNFTAHREATIRFSQLVGDLVSGWLLTSDTRYTDAARLHCRAWFMDDATRMNPNLLYAQAIQGIATGRGIGIIDTIHLMEVSQALRLMDQAGLIPAEELRAFRLWFSDYLTWISTHRYGVAERNAKNNHGTCWVMQAAAFALFTGDEEVLRSCRDQYKTILLAGQMAPDGSFPLELDRTKPYGYALFNLDAMAVTAWLLSTPEEDLWEFTLPDGRGIRKGVEWMFPYVADKSLWQLPPDVMFWEEWPVAHPFLLLACLDRFETRYWEVWKGLEHFPANAEVIRNLPVRHPLLWLP
ncbi:MAG: alginate lyase family protein [Bacteroides sp.]|nr:alginate lyase family protein [Bacteroides sp.]